MSKTTEITTKTLLTAIEKLTEKVDKNQQQNNAQFEAVRQGIVANSADFDRLESLVYLVRSDLSNLKANVKELTEEVHQSQKTDKTLELS